MTLPRWLRGAMGAAAVVNAVGVVSMLPGAEAIRAAGGLADTGHPFYPAALASFILVFGVAYGWSAVTGRADRQFLAVAGAGKLMFFGLMLAYTLAGLLPATAPLGAGADLVLGALFLRGWASTRCLSASETVADQTGRA